MKRSLALRLLLALAALMLLGGLLAFALNGLDRLIAVWERAQAVSPALAVAYAFFLLFFAAAAAALLWWILRPPRHHRRHKNKIPDEDELAARVQHNQALGLDTSPAEQELTELERRRETGELHIALYGQISAGKSSLINTLVPGAQGATGVIGGTTKTLERYTWQSAGGDQIYITDAPGIQAADPDEEAQAREEALRAHLVIYVCEGDLTRDQWQALETLLEFGKPVIVAINKIDRLTNEDLAGIRSRITHRLAGRERISVVAIQTGGSETLVRELPGGVEEQVTRKRQTQVNELLDAMHTQLENRSSKLTGLRDSAMLRLAAGKLDAALDQQRQERADELVRSYTRRAVVGAMAALTPGSDLLIQGALATQFVRELCALYDTQPREVQIEALLKSANRKLRRNSALVLAVAGNGLKAFPGVGTISGGLMHAVAYGLLFDTLGRAMAHNLRTRGELQTEPAARTFETLLDEEDLFPRARRVAQIALGWKNKSDDK